ncbi:MAG: hypothetical protein HOP03_17725 [Lysobacter sp.]|nr:hypothetical protein [Lysobacter sp.]
MSRNRTLLFALSGALVLLACLDSPVLLPYPLLVLAVLRGWRLPRIGGAGTSLMLSMLLASLVLETGAWAHNYLRDAPEPALFHPQLIPDLVIAIGVYASWWLTWWWMLRRSGFTTLQVFLTSGLYGVLIEQQGRIFIAGLSTMPMGLLLWAFVALAYGATMALATFLVRERFDAQREMRWKLPLTWLLLFAMTFATSFVWGLVLQATDAIPPKKLPMREHPFW